MKTTQKKSKNVYNKNILNNFQVKTLDTYLKTQIKDYREQITKYQATGNDGQNSINTLLNQKLKDNYEKNIEIENDLFEFLMTVAPDTYYYYKLDTKGQICDDVFDIITKDMELFEFVDRKLYEAPKEVEVGEIISIRKKKQVINILFRFGKMTTKVREDEKSFFVSCKLDFENKIISIGFLRNTLKKLDDKVFGEKVLLGSLIPDKFKKLNLGISMSEYTKLFVEQAIYKLFVEESEKAIKLIKEKIKIDHTSTLSNEKLKEEIEEFLKEKLNLKYPSSFIEKTLSLKYQDKAMAMEKEEFFLIGGFIFGFGFSDRRLTKSENKSDEHDPVYNSKIFWSLRDIINEYKEMSSVAIYWRFYLDDFKKEITQKNMVDKSMTFAEIEYRTKSKTLNINHYHKTENILINSENVTRNEKREIYVLQRIKKYL